MSTPTDDEPRAEIDTAALRHLIARDGQINGAAARALCDEIDRLRVSVPPNPADETERRVRVAEAERDLLRLACTEYREEIAALEGAAGGVPYPNDERLREAAERVATACDAWPKGLPPAVTVRAANILRAALSDVRPPTDPERCPTCGSENPNAWRNLCDDPTNWHAAPAVPEEDT